MKNLSSKMMLHLDQAYKKLIEKLIDNAEDSGIVMLMHNLLEYSDNCSMTSGSLPNYYTDAIIGDTDENYNASIG